MPEYLSADISTALVCMLRLNYYPADVLEQLNMMARLTILNKDQCLRLLDTLMDF